MRDTGIPYCEYVFKGVGTLCGSNALNVIDGKSYCDHHAKVVSALQTLVPNLSPYSPGDIFKKELNHECWVWVLLSKDKQDWSEDVPVWTAAKFYVFEHQQALDMFGAQVSYLYDSDISGMEHIGTIKSLIKTIPSMSS